MTKESSRMPIKRSEQLMVLQISEKFLHGHSNEELAVVGISVQKNPPPQSAKAALLMAAED